MKVRHRIAAAYERSAWARLVILLVVIGVHLAGQAVLIHLAAPEWAGVLLALAWLFGWCTAVVIYLMPRLQTLKPRVQTIPGRLQVAATLSAQRLRGRAAVERRDRYLRLHPLCTWCEKQGRVGAATVPDHVVPLWAGGADDLEANGQALCAEDHDAKTACEAKMRAAGGWLSTPCTCGMHSPGT